MNSSYIWPCSRNPVIQALWDSFGGFLFLLPASSPPDLWIVKSQLVPACLFPPPQLLPPGSPYPTRIPSLSYAALYPWNNLPPTPSNNLISFPFPSFLPTDPSVVWPFPVGVSILEYRKPSSLENTEVVNPAVHFAFGVPSWSWD